MAAISNLLLDDQYGDGLKIQIVTTSIHPMAVVKYEQGSNLCRKISL